MRSSFEPDRYCCAISHSGVYDWNKTFHYRGLYYNRFLFDNYRVHLGGGENNKAYVKSISPINKVKNIKVPVFLALGSNDHKVITSQAITLMTKLRSEKVQVEQFFRQYERHDFEHQKNITEYYTRVLDFLARNMKKNE